jgi:hypothetical protein
MSEREVLWNALLASRGASADATDEEIAVEDVDGDVVGEINRADWYRTVVWRPELIAEILEAAETNGAESVRMLLAGCGVALVDRSPPLLAG